MDATSEAVIDAERLWTALEEVSRFGATEGGGLDRLAAGEADRAARDYLVAAAGPHTVTVDAVGNVFITREGTEPHLTPVLLGSHLDSQPKGGRYDGTYGVIAGLEVLRALDDAGVSTPRSIVLANWTNEEGARFSPSMLGSAVHAGRHDLDEALARRDADGVTLGAELERIGYRGTGTGPRAVHRSLELHIEQGPVLEAEGLDIGVVTGVAAIHWCDILLRGRSGHAGTTPAAVRRDALVGASRIILALDDLSAQDPDLRVTVGELRLLPNSRNAIPGEVRLAVDLRHQDGAALAEVAARLVPLVTSAVGPDGPAVEVETVLTQPPTVFDAGTVELVRQTARALGYTSTDLASGAGHDSVHLAHLTRAGMIFIPCVDGVSHREDEDITPQWASAGAAVLLHAALRAAREAEGT